ncbi:MAG: hypothetical protein EBZ34_06160, partial [Flavobacteriia bacterium]|nr:hypothetical protein [Flavobacteriia bacterium]
MKWLAGTWSSEEWATWAKESPWDFPYDQEGYADALGQTWGAVAGVGLAWPMAYRRKGMFWTAYLPFGMQQWGPVGAQANRSARVLAAAAAIPAWGLGPQGEALDADGIPFLTYVPVALM